MDGPGVTRQTSTARPVGGASLLIVGGGGHGLVVSEAARLAGIEIRGFVDDSTDAPLGAGAGSCRYLGKIDEIISMIADDRDNSSWIVAIGDVSRRGVVIAEIGAQLAGMGALPGSVVHPEAFISPTARIGAGVFVGPRAVVHSRAEVRDHAIVNTGAIVEHDCVIGEGSHIAPGTVLGGGTRIGRGVLMGIGSRTLPRVLVGDGAVVGAGSVVLRDVAAGSRVAGVPARGMR